MDNWFSIPGLLSSIHPTATQPGMEGSFSASNVPIAPGISAGYDLAKFQQGPGMTAGKAEKTTVSDRHTGLSAGKEKVSFGDFADSAPFIGWSGGDNNLHGSIRRRYGKSKMLPDQWEAELGMPAGTLTGYKQDDTGMYGAGVNIPIPLNSGLLAERDARFGLGNAGLSAQYDVNPYQGNNLNILLNWNKGF